MRQGQENMQLSKGKGFERGQRLIFGGIMRKINANPEKGYLLYDETLLSAKTIARIESLGFGVEVNYTNFEQPSYLIRWYDSTARFAEEMNAKFQRAQPSAVDRIFRKMEDSCENGFLVYDETYLLPLTRGLIEATGFGVESYRTGIGKFSYLVRWHDCTADMAGEEREAFLFKQVYVEKEILEGIKAGVDKGYFVYKKAFLAEETLQRFIDRGYWIMYTQGTSGQPIYKFSWG